MVNTACTHDFVKGSRKRFGLGVNSSPIRIPRKKRCCVVNDGTSLTTDKADGQEDDDMFLNLLLPPLEAVGQEQDESVDIMDDLLEYDPAMGSFIDGEVCDDDCLLEMMGSFVDDDDLLAASSHYGLHDVSDAPAPAAVDFVEQILEFDEADAASLQAVMTAVDTPIVEIVGDTLAMDKPPSEVPVSDKSSSVEVNANAIPMVEVVDVPSRSKGLLHSIAYILTYFHGGNRQCIVFGCYQLGQLKGRAQLNLCRFHRQSAGSVTGPKEVTKCTDASDVTLKQVKNLKAVAVLRDFVHGDEVLFANFNKAVIDVEALLKLRLPLVCNAGSMIANAINPFDVHHLLLSPVVVHFVMKAIDFGTSASLVYNEVLAKLSRANAFWQQVAFEVNIPTEAMSRLPKDKNFMKKVKRKFSLVVWCSRFLLDCINCTEAYNLVDAFINVCKVPGQRQDEDIIQVMASLGFQMNLLARMSANHARDCSFTKSKDLIVFSVDRTKIGELVRCILMPLYNDLLAVLFTYGFFPEVSSFEVCQHSSEFLQLVDGSLSIGQLHAHVIRYMSLMLDNMGLSSSMKNVNDFSDIVMDGNERVFTLPTFVAAYVAFICKCVVSRSNKDGPFKSSLWRHTAHSNKIQLVGCNAQPFEPVSFGPFAIWHKRFETSMLKIAHKFFEVTLWRKRIAVDVGLSGGSGCDIKIFDLNVTSNLDTCDGGIDPMERLEVLTSIVSNIRRNPNAHTAYCSTVFMHLIQAFDIVAGSSTNPDENNELQSELENDVAKIVLLLNDRLQNVGRRAGAGVNDNSHSHTLDLSEGSDYGLAVALPVGLDSLVVGEELWL